MKIEHVAIWARDLEGLKAFYEEYFKGISGAKYRNTKTGFESYFISFDQGARLELMQKPGIEPGCNSESIQHEGLIHIAFSAGSKDKVDELTKKLRSSRIRVVSEPRYTGDGYYESCIMDPEGNRVEITE